MPHLTTHTRALRSGWTWFALLLVSSSLLSGCGGLFPNRQPATLPPTKTNIVVTLTKASQPTAVSNAATNAAATAAMETTLAVSDPLPALTASAITAQDVKFINRQITFTVRFDSAAAQVDSVTFLYRFPSTDVKGERKSVASQTGVVQTSMSVDTLPPQEDQVEYQWRFSSATGQSLTTAPIIWKITEATTAEQRKDRPIIRAVQTYASNFPTNSIFTVSVLPEVPIANARFFVTQNNGIEQLDFAVTVPTRKVGEKLDLKMVWNNQFGPQIPWQQFESWWVFRDVKGREWRTESSYNVYADQRFHKWTLTKSQFADIYTYDRTAAENAFLARAADTIITRLTAIYGYKLLYRPHLVMYNNETDLREWDLQGLMRNSEFVGLASGQWGGAVVMFYNTLDYTAYNILQHEVVHLFQFQSWRTGKQLIPSWWIEGSARYFEKPGIETDPKTVVTNYLKYYSPPSLVQGVTSIAPDGRNIGWLYWVGATFVEFFRDKYGDTAFQEVHQALARDIRFDEALKMATGKGISELSAEWQSWISQQ